MELPVMRSEFGFERTQCGCARCSVFCRFMPGYLVPNDLERLIPTDADPLVWARVHLRALVPASGGTPSLVPAQVVNRHCHWYEEGRCSVWQNSPYGCAFFDQHMSLEEHERRNRPGWLAREEAFAQNTLYAQLWHSLMDAGLVTTGRNEELNARLMAEFQDIARREGQAASAVVPATDSWQRGVAELLAYDCPLCRRLHHELQAAQRRYGERLVLHFLPVPMCPQCNPFVNEANGGLHRGCEYARLAWAVRSLNQDLFRCFHDWLMEPHEVPPPTAAHHYASTLVGPDALARALASSQLKQELRRMIQVYDGAGRGTLPKLISGRAILNGEPNRETLTHFLEQVVGVNGGV